MMNWKKLGLMAAVPMVTLMGVEMAAAQDNKDPDPLPAPPTQAKCVGQKFSKKGKVPVYNDAKGNKLDVPYFTITWVTTDYTYQGGLRSLLPWSDTSAPGDISAYRCAPSVDCDQDTSPAVPHACMLVDDSVAGLGEHNCKCVPGTPILGPTLIGAASVQVKADFEIPALEAAVAKIEEAAQVIAKAPQSVTSQQMSEFLQAEQIVAGLIGRLETNGRLVPSDFEAAIGTILKGDNMDVLEFKSSTGRSVRSISKRSES